MFELSAQMLAEEESKQSFMAAQLRGDPKRALQLLDELDAIDCASKQHSIKYMEFKLNCYD